METQNPKYNLQERTLNFGKDIIRLCKSIKYCPVSFKIIDQLVRSGTSVGANYMEAINGSSKKDFKNKLFICKKESQETKYWLSMLKESESDRAMDITPLIQECHELNLIFQKSINTVEENLILNKLKT
ncbi:MAG: four helix bundle protein [Candidatus Berkelbacteria bacterium]